MLAYTSVLKQAIKTLRLFVETVDWSGSQWFTTSNSMAAHCGLAGLE